MSLFADVAIAAAQQLSTPTDDRRLAQDTLADAIDYLQFNRNPQDWPFFSCQPREQAIRILFASLARVQGGF